MTAARYDLGKITERLGDDFSLRVNAYKPYACGLVVHPTIDGCSRIRERDKPDPARIRAIRLRVAPLVLDLCNQKDLKRALQTKYSIYHAAAIGLARGKGGLAEFTDEALDDPVLARLRSITTATGDPAVGEDQVHIEVELDDGRLLELFVEESLGNLGRPLSDAQLEEKFRDQAVRVLAPARVDALIAQCWRIDELEDAGELARAAALSDADGAAERVAAQ